MSDGWNDIEDVQFQRMLGVFGLDVQFKRMLGVFGLDFQLKRMLGVAGMMLVISTQTWCIMVACILIFFDCSLGFSFSVRTIFSF